MLKIDAHVHIYPDKIAAKAAKGIGKFYDITIHHDGSITQMIAEEDKAGVSRMVAAGFKGVKLHPDFQEFQLDEPRALRMFSMIADAGLPVLIHTGDYRYDYSNPPRMAHLLDEIPNLVAIGAHLGGWSVYDEARRTLAGRRNFYVDTSSALYALKPDHAVELIRAFGAGRVMFGTDYPMWTPAEEVERFDALPLTEAEREQIYHGTAEELLG